MSTSFQNSISLEKTLYEGLKKKKLVTYGTEFFQGHVLSLSVWVFL